MSTPDYVCAAVSQPVVLVKDVFVTLSVALML